MVENGKGIGGNEYILECQGLSKSFGGTKALQNVELHIKKVKFMHWSERMVQENQL